MLDFAADKAVLVKPHFAEGVLALPGDAGLRGEVHQPFGADAHAVADAAQISVFVAVSGGVTLRRNGPGRADIVVVQELVAPHLRVDDKAVRVDDHGVIRADVTAQFVDHLVVEVVDGIQRVSVGVPDCIRQIRGLLVGNQHRVAEVDPAHAVFHGFDRRADIHARHGAERHVRQLQFSVPAGPGGRRLTHAARLPAPESPGPPAWSARFFHPLPCRSHRTRRWCSGGAR